MKKTLLGIILLVLFIPSVVHAYDTGVNCYTDSDCDNLASTSNDVSVTNGSISLIGDTICTWWDSCTCTVSAVSDLSQGYNEWIPLVRVLFDVPGTQDDSGSCVCNVKNTVNCSQYSYINGSEIVNYFAKVSFPISDNHCNHGCNGVECCGNYTFTIPCDESNLCSERSDAINNGETIQCRHTSNGYEWVYKDEQSREIDCSNLIDDDCDGLVDLNDTDCQCQLLSVRLYNHNETSVGVEAFAVGAKCGEATHLQVDVNGSDGSHIEYATSKSSFNISGVFIDTTTWSKTTQSWLLGFPLYHFTGIWPVPDKLLSTEYFYPIAAALYNGDPINGEVVSNYLLTYNGNWTSIEPYTGPQKNYPCSVTVSSGPGVAPK